MMCMARAVVVGNTMQIKTILRLGLEYNADKDDS